MSNKRRAKRPYNPRKIIERGTQNLVFEHREIWGEEIRSHFDSGAVGQIFENRPNEAVCRAAVQVRRRWYLELTAWCIDSFGKPYPKSLPPMVSEPCLLDDLRDYYIRRRDQLERSCNAKHLVTIGFIARPMTAKLEQTLEKKA